ncbi:hypothetical protein GCM10009719_17940 [Nocardioides kribbensis]
MAAATGRWDDLPAAHVGHDLGGTMGTTLVFLAVIGGRFLLPLAIPRWPLPAIVACLVLDGVDQTIFQLFGHDPPGYQSYDKAMDVYYLAIAYLATLRNWTSLPAFRVARFLYFYRLVGVVAFELSHARALLLVFPNTFEYFFIAYEAVRARWRPTRFGLRWWITAAALIWVLVKLPQEWWIHVARLDVTDMVGDHPVGGLVVAAGAVSAASIGWRRYHARLRPPDHPTRFAADPLPAEVDTAEERLQWHWVHGALLSWTTVEKVVLVGLLAVVYAQTLPGVRSTPLQLFLGVGVVVVVNALLTLAAASRRRSIESSLMAFLARMLVNVVLVLAAELLLGVTGGDLDISATLFYLALISLVTTLHDAWRPVLALRQRDEAAAPA